MTPNFFISEYSFSQEEAFLRWFLQWTIESNKTVKPHLHATAKSFLTLVCSRANFHLDFEIDRVRDVTHELGSENGLWFILNDDAALEINTGNLYDHVLDEIQKNRTKLVAEYNIASSRVCAFTYDCQDFANDIRGLTDQGFPLIDRRDLLRLFSSLIGIQAELESDTYSDFKKYLLQLENEAQRFLRLPPSEWKWAQWAGYCHELYLRFGNGRHGLLLESAHTSQEFFDMEHRVVEGGVLFLRISNKHHLSFILLLEDRAERRKWYAYWQNKVFATSQQLGLEIVRPHRVGVGRDAVLATQAQSYMVLKEVGVIDLEATENIIKLVTIIVKNPAMIFKKFTN